MRLYCIECSSYYKGGQDCRAAGRGGRGDSIVKLLSGENRAAVGPPRPALATAASVPPAWTEAEQREAARPVGVCSHGGQHWPPGWTG